tara:strand:- start:5260 stop:6570 length:1311 start_codon:yes stop_codon:yes gene_type:complete
MLGGAGNVVRNVVALGAHCTFVSAIGTDSGGKRLTDLVARLENVEAYLLRESGRPSTIKTRYMAEGQQLLRADQETDVSLAPATESDIRLAALDAISGCDAVILSDYGKGVLSDPVIESVINRTRELGKPVIVDPKGQNFGRYSGSDFVTPNNAELALASGKILNDEQSIISAARDLLAEHDVKSFLVTRSQEGMSLIDARSATHIPAQVQEVFDVSGAGDTVVAVFAAAIAVGLEPTEAANIANIAAGLVVGKLGTAAISVSDLHHAVLHNRLAGGTDKLVVREAAAEVIKDWRKMGQRVGFTNGCFDILHPGHLSLLHQARESCDHLVVGLNSDSSVARLKGVGRPVQKEGDRAKILAALSDVDLVIIFEEDTPESLIQTISPDLLVKGADYNRADVVGADFVEGRGGKVLLVELEPGYSTSGTIARIIGKQDG